MVWPEDSVVLCGDGEDLHLYGEARGRCGWCVVMVKTCTCIVKCVTKGDSRM